MKTKINFLVIAALSLSLAFISCNSQNKKSAATEQSSTEKVVYTCPMHPEVTSDKPGKCPKCGMDMVKKEPTENNSKTDQDSTDKKNK